MKALRYLRDAAVFAACYVALDWVSYVQPLGSFNITPWNPQPALAIIWMLLGGLRYVPIVLATIFLADIVVRDAPGGYLVTAATALTLACGYALIAQVLRVLLRPAFAVQSIQRLTQFVIVVIFGTAIVGAAFVAVLWASNFVTEGAVLDAWLRFWIGDSVGVLVTAPLLLAAANSESRHNVMRVVRRSETWLQAATLAMALWIVFTGLGVDPATHFYLLFPPLIWIAVRGGTSGALIAVAIIQLGIVIAIHGDNSAALPLLELQAFVASLALTALYLGMMVDERQTAAANLRETLRLAAAGEMAGALAHELNQPLTALANYGRSAQLILSAGGKTLDQLPSVIEQMLAEGLRAGEVVRRLRDFFRTGTTRLEFVQVEQILSAARNIAQHISGQDNVAITTTVEGDLPPLYVDRMQIELTLRNLVANAFEAVADRRDGSARISITAERHDPQSIRITVADNGPGIPPAIRDTLFEPFASGTARGMGLGLAVSRAIAEAHGGSLTARASEHGEFEMVLPCT